MPKELAKISDERLELLLEDCKAIVVEHEFNSRWELLTGYHKLGLRLLEEKERKYYGEQMLQRVAESIGRSYRTVSYAVQFAEKYPDIDSLPEGKAASWSRVVKKLLPEPKEEREEKCKHCIKHCP